MVRNRHRTLLISALALFLISPAGFAKVPATTGQTAAAEAISDVIRPFVGKDVAGAATLVATKDRILEQSAVGVSALETRRPMLPTDLFWIASMSKPLAAICIGILHDDGKLSFDDPVSKFIPEFAAAVPPGGAPLTLRRLLTHTGGLGEQMTRDPHQTLAQTAVMAAHVPLRYEVGARWSYSTLGIEVVGRVVEVASGRPLDQFLRERLFRPLGMVDTSFWVPPGDLDRLAHSYRLIDGALVPATIPYMYGTEPADRQRPPLIGAGLFSTAQDIVRVYQMMLGNGVWHGHRILAAQTVAELLRPQPGTHDARPGMAWGLGFSVVEDPAKFAANAILAPASFGHGGAYGTSIWADPSRGLIYVLMIQRAGLPNPDNSGVRIAFQKAAAESLWSSPAM